MKTQEIQMRAGWRRAKTHDGHVRARQSKVKTKERQTKAEWRRWNQSKRE